jgi:hypothetical protein
MKAQTKSVPVTVLVREPMTLQVLRLPLSGQVYRRLQEVADAAQQSMEQVALHSLQMGLPPSLEYVPARFRVDLQALHRLSDEVLWQVARTDLPEDKAALYETLLDQNQCTALSPAEQETLENLREEADALMLRRTYAYALLKWRGQQIPTMSEIAAPVLA